MLGNPLNAFSLRWQIQRSINLTRYYLPRLKLHAIGQNQVRYVIFVNGTADVKFPDDRSSIMCNSSISRC